MKVVFEGILWGVEQIDNEDSCLTIDFGHIDIGHDENLNNIIAKLYHIESKYVRVTIEGLPDPKVKNDMPICYAAMESV